ncbi:IS30 family transposase [Zobellella denitrificans]|uniref:IS30 family transposase n=1 Tax=Zobellella denitrificans TaxID=347534 RepID=UPI000B8C3A60|nr:IS30 family transposase [Zobellella denitrificans]OXS15705.1 IS30 family transposase [Zobellella denitrificans]
MSYQQLTEGQRYQISVLLAEGLSHSRIAQRVGIHRSTISRELRRNRHQGDYVPAQAHQQTLIRRAKARKYQVDSDTQQLVELLLSWQWSPEQISAIAKRIGFPVSHEWIYCYVARDKARGGRLYRQLRQGHKRYRKGRHGKRSPILEARSIDERPLIVDNRERLGDWEADTVLGQQGSGVLVTLAERKSRLYLVKRVESKHADVVRDAVIEMLSPYADHVHSITFDNGGEFAEHKAIAAALHTEAYFAHPYSSWERGLNENFNGLLRQYIPKGTDLRQVTDDEIEQVQIKLNLRPRKCLEFRQPAVVFEELRQAA